MRGEMRGIRAYRADHCKRTLTTGVTEEHRVGRCSGWPGFRVIRYGLCDYLFSCSPKLNRSLRSPIAGLFNGTYGLLLLVMGLGKLSRLRAVSGASPQLASMNFRIEAWSA